MAGFVNMDTSSIDSFWAESVGALSWCSQSRDLQSTHEPTPYLDLDALEVALSRLDHSPQKGKAFVGRSGALSNRRPPSRGSRSSRLSSTDSLHLVQDQQGIDDDLVIPRVVNIEVQLEENHKAKAKLQENTEKDIKTPQEQPHASSEYVKEHSFSENKSREKRRSIDSFTTNQEIRKKLFESRHRRSVAGSNPLLNSTLEAEESFRRIKEEVARLVAKRRSSSDISDLSRDTNSEFSSLESSKSEALKRWNEERESLLESASTVFERNSEGNRSSSEADFVISDRESIADSGLVNRRTVIKISEKKSKSATSLSSDNSVPLWKRDSQTRRSLRSDKDNSVSRIIPIAIDPDFEGGINVSILNQPESPRKESTSRMYVRQSDSENRPSRASAFNVRRTIEKRQVQQERRERKALREQIKEQLRSLSEERERRDSSSSHVSSIQYSQTSSRSKSMSSLDQDQDDFRSESPLFKVQSSPTLEKEKEGIRSYLFGASNLTESGPPSHEVNLGCRNIPITKKSSSKVHSNKAPQTQQHRQEYTRSCDLPLLRTENSEKESNCISSSVDSFQIPKLISQQLSEENSSLHQESGEIPIENWHAQKTAKVASVSKPHDSEINDREFTKTKEKEKSFIIADSVEFAKEDPQETRPIPPPRKHRLSLSAGHITLEGEEKPNWVRLAKERRSLRTARQVDQLSDRASSTCQEPEWVTKARRKLEGLNVTLTSTTDVNSVSSHITESSSAWSRGGLDALDDLREETNRIGQELAEEASARVKIDLDSNKDTNKMLEHNTDRSRDPSSERPRVSFEPSAVESSDGESSRRYRSRKPQKDEVRFGDLKHDWGGVQTKSSKTSTGKTKEMRFGEIHTKETVTEVPSEKAKETRFGDHMKNSQPPASSSNPASPNGNLPVMRFGDTPLNLFPEPQFQKVQSSSKFESIAGPDPTKMTAEQLNQNVEEYDFPIPTGNEDATEFMKFLEESLKKADIVPEVVSIEDHKPKPKSILKRRSVENVFLELKKEEKSEFHQKVEHRKSASFDWDTVGKGGDASLDTGNLRNNGARSSTELSNRIRKSSQQNLPTPISATNNNSFFNIKLRHVTSNKREPTITNDSHSFSTEHTLLKRSQGVNLNAKHNENSSQINTYTNSLEVSIGNQDTSNDVGWLEVSADSDSRPLKIPELGSPSEAAFNGSNTSKDDPMTDLEEYKKVVKKISKKEFHVGNHENKSHITRWTCNLTKGKAKDEKRHSHAIASLPQNDVVTAKSNAVRELLQKVQEPASATWGTCRAGRGLDATEPDEVNENLSSAFATTCQSLVEKQDEVDGRDDLENIQNISLQGSEKEILGTGEDAPEDMLKEEISNKSKAESVGNSSTNLQEITASHQESDASDEKNQENKIGASHQDNFCIIANNSESCCQGKDEETETIENDDFSVAQPVVSDYEHVSGKELTQQTTHLSPHTASFKASCELTPVVAVLTEEDNNSTSSATAPEPISSTTKTSENDESERAAVINESTCTSKEKRDEDSVENRQAKVFSFTFNPEQKTKPETSFINLEDTLFQQQSQNEMENKRKTEGMKVFTIITNPKSVHQTSSDEDRLQVNGHVGTAAVHQQLSAKEEVNLKESNQNDKNRQSPIKYQEVTNKSPLKKLVTQNFSGSNAERKKSTERNNEIQLKQKIYQLKVELPEDNQRKLSSRKREDERKSSSLLEWEAMQRQRLEDEERNRINKNLSMKPVSTKIKELVKMHGNFMSMFSKDKKTDINGTVDGKDDIVFRKVSVDNTVPFDVNNHSLQEGPLPMKSPYIVKKLLTPSKLYSSSSSKSNKNHQKDSSKPPAVEQRTSRMSRSNSKTHAVRESSLSPVKIRPRERSQSPAKVHSSKERSASPSKIHTSRNRSPSPSKIQNSVTRSPSPTKKHSSRERPSPRISSTKERSPSPRRKHSTKDNSSPQRRTHTTRGRSPSPRRIHSTKERSPSPSGNYTTKGKSLSPSKTYSSAEKSASPNEVQSENIFPSAPVRIQPPARKRSQSPTKPLITDKITSGGERFHAKETQQVNGENTHSSQKMSHNLLHIKNNSSETVDMINRNVKSPELVKKVSGSLHKNNYEYSSSQPSTFRASVSLQDEDNGSANIESPSKINMIHETKEHTAISNFDRRISPPIPPKPSFLKKMVMNHHSPQKKAYGAETDEPGSREMMKSISTDQTDIEHQKINERSSIKDPQNRKEWLHKMLSTISADHASTPAVSPSHDASSKLIDEGSLSPKKEHDTSRLKVSDLILPMKTSKDESLYEPEQSSLTKSNDISSVTKSRYIKSPKASTQPSSSFLSKYSSMDEHSLLKKTEVSPPSTPVSLRSSIGESYENLHYKRGPVSLSSIIGDSSSRSSSLASTPLTSPRATPERVIRKDSLDITSKLDVIPETFPKESIGRTTYGDRNARSDLKSARLLLSEESFIKSSSPTTKAEKDYRPRKDNLSENSIKQSPPIKPYFFGKSYTPRENIGLEIDPEKDSSFKTPSTSYLLKTASEYNRVDSPTESYQSNSYPRDNKDPIRERFSKERISLKAKLMPDTGTKILTTYNSSEQSDDLILSPKLRTRTFSDRSTPEREGPVSLASILARNEGSKYSISEEPSDIQFKPNISFSNEMEDLTRKYCKNVASLKSASENTYPSIKSRKSQEYDNYDSDDVFDKKSLNTRGGVSRESSLEPDSRESTPARETKGDRKSRITKEKPTVKKKPKDASSSPAPPKNLPRRGSNAGKQNRLVRRNSSLKRQFPEESQSHLAPKKERKPSEDNAGDVKETVVQDNSGWTKTKTTVRRARLGSAEKAKQIVRTNSGKTKKEKTFKSDASQALEAWAAGANVEGKLMKKEGQRFCHETEEEVKGGQRTTRSVARRVVRRGSRRLSGGGELLTETKEMASEGAPKDGKKVATCSESAPTTQALAIDDGLSRKMKTSTDGERYITQSVSTKDGKKTFTTEGVNNKTTNSIEVIGGDDFEAKREVQGKTGHRLVVERSKDNLGRPSTVVKKVTSQSRVVITKTKRKSPVVV